MLIQHLVTVNKSKNSKIILSCILIGLFSLFLLSSTRVRPEGVFKNQRRIPDFPKLNSSSRHKNQNIFFYTGSDQFGTGNSCSCSVPIPPFGISEWQPYACLIFYLKEKINIKRMLRSGGVADGLPAKQSSHYINMSTIPDSRLIIQ